MRELELEQLLEAGLYALGVPFGRRVYYEEIMAGASVDDDLEQLSTEEYLKKINNPSLSLLKKLKFEIKGRDLLTDYQKDALDEPPMFKRVSENYNGFIIEYRVSSTKIFTTYEEKADRIISKGKIDSQAIRIYSYIDGQLNDIICVGILHKRKEMRIVVVDIDYDTIPKVDLQKKIEAIEALKSLEGQPYDSLRICKAVFDFIR